MRGHLGIRVTGVAGRRAGEATDCRSTGKLMCATPRRDGGATGEMGHVLHMFRPHHPGRIHRHVHQQPVEVHILLRVGVDEVVIVVAGDGEHWLLIELGIVEAVEQVHAAGAGGRQTYPEAAVYFA